MLTIAVPSTSGKYLAEDARFVTSPPRRIHMTKGRREVALVATNFINGLSNYDGASACFALTTQAV